MARNAALRRAGPPVVAGLALLLGGITVWYAWVVARHHPRVPNRDPTEQQRQPRHDWRTRAAERGVTRHGRRMPRDAPFRGTGRAPPEPSRSRRAAASFRGAPRWCAAAPRPTR